MNYAAFSSGPAARFSIGRRLASVTRCCGHRPASAARDTIRASTLSATSLASASWHLREALFAEITGSVAVKPVSTSLVRQSDVRGYSQPR